MRAAEAAEAVSAPSDELPEWLEESPPRSAHAEGQQEAAAAASAEVEAALAARQRRSAELQAMLEGLQSRLNALEST